MACLVSRSEPCNESAKLIHRAQTATVGAAIYYGGVAMTSAKQNEYFQKQRVLLGMCLQISHLELADV